MLLMLCDHIALVYSKGGWRLLPDYIYNIRIIARISFPIFAYFIVVGWQHTRDKQKYLFRLFLCALASQIPFTLAFNIGEIYNGTSAHQLFGFGYTPAAIVIAVVFAFAYWYFFLRKKKSWAYALVILAACLIGSITSYNYKGMHIFDDELNVLYTLGIGALIFFEIDNIRERSLRWWEHLFLIAAIVLTVYAFGLPADYGKNLMGLILIVSLYLCRKCKLLQSLIIFVWGCVFYGAIDGNVYYAAATLLAAALVFVYNGQSGPKNRGTKYLFYVFYPAHLLIIGFVNVYLVLMYMYFW